MGAVFTLGAVFFGELFLTDFFGLLLVSVEELFFFLITGVSAIETTFLVTFLVLFLGRSCVVKLSFFGVVFFTVILYKPLV